MTHGAEHFPPDDRNATLLIHLDGRLVSRDEALISVFDSGFVLGDGVWEGIRVHNGRPAFLEAHLRRLYDGAKALFLDIGLTPDEMRARIQDTISANELVTGAHLRLMVTRGIRSAPFQDPSLVVSPATVVIVPQYMQAREGAQERGLTLGTVAVRRGRPDVQDPSLNTHSKLNCVTACIQAKQAGYDEGLMLDPHGFVATCNSTHFFLVRDGELWTSTGDYCLDGITRRTVLELADACGIPRHERNFSLSHVYAAQEAFCTGTLIGLMPVASVDGRRLEHQGAGPLTRRLQEAYRQRIVDECGAF